MQHMEGLLFFHQAEFTLSGATDCLSVFLTIRSSRFVFIGLNAVSVWQIHFMVTLIHYCDQENDPIFRT